MSENGEKAPERCQHPNVNPIGNVKTPTPEQPFWVVALGAVCSDCGEPFVFLGLPIGFDPSTPGILAGGIQGHLPILPRSTIYPPPPEVEEQPKRPALVIPGSGRRAGN